jgi:hypothetical protein
MLGFTRDDLNIVSGVSTKDQKRFVSGILYSPKDKVLVVTDGKCMIIRPLQEVTQPKVWPDEKEITQDIIIPVEVFLSLKKLKSKKSNVNNTYLFPVYEEDSGYSIRYFDYNDNMFKSYEFKPLEGNFPPYKKILKERENKITLTISFKELKKVWEGLGSSQDSNNMLQLEIDKEDQTNALLTYKESYSSGFAMLLLGSNNGVFPAEELYEKLRKED